MSNTEVVLTFINAWNTENWDAVCDAFADNIVYHNIPMEKIEGKVAADAFIRGMGVSNVDWEVLAIAEAGNRVLTERIDRMDMPNGKRIELPLMGIFEVEDGKITEFLVTLQVSFVLEDSDE